MNVIHGSGANITTLGHLTTQGQHENDGRSSFLMQRLCSTCNGKLLITLNETNVQYVNKLPFKAK